MQADLFELMISLYRHQGFHILPLYDIKKEIEEIDLGFRKKMVKNFDYNAEADWLISHLDPGLHYLMEDDLGISYSLFRFSEEQAEEYHCRILAISPLLFHSLDHNAFELLMNEKKVPNDYRQDYLEFFNRIPIVSSYDTWIHMLSFFLSRLYGGPIQLVPLSSKQDGWDFF